MTTTSSAKPGMIGPPREVIAELVRQVRREPGCLTFTGIYRGSTCSRAMRRFVDDHRGAYGVKRICRALEIDRSSYYDLLAQAQVREAKALDWKTPAEAFNQRLLSVSEAGVATID